MPIFTRTSRSESTPSPVSKPEPTTFSFARYSELRGGLIEIKQRPHFPETLILTTPWQRYDISVKKTMTKDPAHKQKYLNQYKVTDISQTDKLLHANPFTLAKALWWKIIHCFSSDRKSEITAIIEKPVKTATLTATQ